jgi:hypothetical protein
MKNFQSQLILAVAVLYAIQSASWAAPGSTGAERSVSAASSSFYPTEQAPLPTRSIESPADAERSKARESRDEKHDADDLSAQLRVADAAEKQIWLGWAAWALSLIGVWLLWSTLRETRKTSQAAQADAEANAKAAENARKQLRAYVSAQPDFVDNVGPTTIRMRLSLTNHGATPASKVVTAVAIGILPFPLPQQYPFVEPASAIGEGGATIHSGSTVTVHSTESFPVTDIANAIKNAGVRIYMYGTVQYEDAFGLTQTTRFCRSVVWDPRLVALANNPAVRQDLLFEITNEHQETT